jgi:hypothetical protein
MTPVDDLQPLQFDTAVPQNAGALDAPARLECRNCGQALLHEYFDVSGAPVCASCRDLLEQYGQPPRGIIPLARAALFGLGAAVAGAILYYGVIAITNLEIGLVAIAIGFMVGYAVRKGTGGRGGRAFQIMALVLTYWSVGLAYLPLVFGDREQTRPSSTQSTASDATASVAVQATQPAAPLPAAGEVAFPIAVAIMFAFSFALPLMVVIGSFPGGLISAAIIAFGMHQAWRMTASPQFTITGPFRVGTAQQPAT